MDTWQAFMTEAEALAYMVEHHCPEFVERNGGTDVNLVRIGTVWMLHDATDRTPKTAKKPQTLET